LEKPFSLLQLAALRSRKLCEAPPWVVEQQTLLKF
jgi:hypothetical protein